jgi:hypothetical protein
MEGLYDWDKSLTGGFGHDNEDIYGRRIPCWGVDEVMPLRPPPSCPGENLILDWAAVAPWRCSPS